MESDEKAQERAARRALLKATSARIKAQNEADRAARNARRWKAERDPLEYEAQKERQRREYQPRGGGPVRSYEKIVATTEADHDQQAKARDAERQKHKYGGLTTAQKQAKSDEIADRAWMSRRRDKGIPEDIIQAGLIVRMQERDAKRNVQTQDSADQAATGERLLTDEELALIEAAETPQAPLPVEDDRLAEMLASLQAAMDAEAK